MAVLPRAGAAPAPQRPDAARSRLQSKLGMGRSRATKGQPTQGAGGLAAQQKTAGLAVAAAAVGVSATTPQVIESRCGASLWQLSMGIRAELLGRTCTREPMAH